MTVTVGKSDPIAVPTSIPKRLDFDSRFFDDAVRYVYGDKVLAIVDKWRADPKFQNMMRSYMVRTDTLADALVEAMSRHPDGKEQYETAAREGIGAVSDPMPELVDFIRSAEEVPACIDLVKAQRGADVIRTKIDAVLLGVAAPPCAAYMAAMTANVSATLVWNGAYNDVRAAESLSYLAKTVRPDAIVHGREMLAASTWIRVVHGYVRRQIYAQPGRWDHDGLGTPISTFDACTVLASAIGAVFACAQGHFGQRYSAEELDAVTHYCNYMTHLQGVPEELLFPTFEEMCATFAILIATTNPAVGLRDVMTTIHQDNQTDQASKANPPMIKRILTGLTVESVSRTLGPQVIQHYQMPTGQWWASLGYTAATAQAHAQQLLSDVFTPVKSWRKRNCEKFWLHDIDENLKKLMRNQQSPQAQTVEKGARAHSA